MSKTDGVLVQEDLKGRVAVCPLLKPVSVGRDREKAAFLLRGDREIEPLHAELVAEFDGSISVRPVGEAKVWVNERPVGPQGATARAGDAIRVGPNRRLTVLALLDSHAEKRKLGLLALPQRIDDLILLKALGRGSAGLVYEGFDESLNERCAVKVLVAGGRAHPELIARFRREAEKQAELKDYPGIVSMHRLGTIPDSGELYCVMEFVSGATLRDRIHNGIDRLEGVRLMARVARAVHYAHEHGLIHRDLKPANVLVSDRGTVRLTDFGLCKALEEEDGLTATGVLLGTPSFMAPEQIDDSKRVRESADTYALGAILFNVLTGQLPFGGANIQEVLEDVSTGLKHTPRDLQPNVPPDLSEVCVRAMKVDPSARYESALALANALEAWARKAAPPERVTLSLPSKPSGDQTRRVKRKKGRKP